MGHAQLPGIAPDRPCLAPPPVRVNVQADAKRPCFLRVCHGGSLSHAPFLRPRCVYFGRPCGLAARLYSPCFFRHGYPHGEAGRFSARKPSRRCRSPSSPPESPHLPHCIPAFSPVNLVSVSIRDAYNRPPSVGTTDRVQQFPFRPDELDHRPHAGDCLKVAPSGCAMDTKGGGQGDRRAPVHEGKAEAVHPKGLGHSRTPGLGLPSAHGVIPPPPACASAEGLAIYTQKPLVPVHRVARL